MMRWPRDFAKTNESGLDSLGSISVAHHVRFKAFPQGYDNDRRVRVAEMYSQDTGPLPMPTSDVVGSSSTAPSMLFSLVL